MFATSKIELSRSAVEHNLSFIRNILGDKSRLSCVVKGNAYGHGYREYIPLIEANGVNHFSVFSADEAYEVQKNTTGDVELMIMGMVAGAGLEWAIEHGVHFFVFDLPRLREALKYAQRVGKPALLHLEVETGMNRTGLESEELWEAIELCREHSEHLQVRGLCTHLAGAESIANYYRIKEQQKVFRRTMSALKKHGVEPHSVHAACSAGAIRYPQTRFDLSRIGIMQYGFFPNRETLIHFLTKSEETDYPLERVLSWKSRVMDLKEVGAGEFIGYGTSYFTNRPTTIALIPVGYSHGFSRTLSNQGRVLIRGARLSVIGMVNMNMMAVDVTENIPAVERGDEVVIIGNQGDLELSVSSFSEYSDQVNYELLTRLPSEIPRLVVD